MDKRPGSLNVSEAKKNLSDLLGRVAYRGETIVITRRGKPMAKLVPMAAREPAPDEARGLGDVEGWLDDDDPFFAIMDGVVAARREERPRSVELDDDPGTEGAAR